MQKELILSKGKYSYEQPEELLSLRQYLFLRDGRRKQLVLRFRNDRRERCDAFAFLLVKLDAKGKVLGEELFEYGGEPIAAGATFAFDKKINVEERCTDFRVQLVRASFGNYTYEMGAEAMSVSYVRKSNSAGRRTPRATHRLHIYSPRLPWLYVIVALVLLSAVFLAALYQVNEFTKTEDEFVLYGVQYEFVDPESDSNEVIITGYAGLYRSILLPSEIEGHPVVGIKEGAFEGNQLLKRVRIEGLEVSRDAFRGCKNLEEVQLADVTVICEGAFAECESLLAIESDTLTEIEARAFENCINLARFAVSNEDEAHMLYVDETAFAGCKGLREISIDTYLHYNENQALFADTLAIETLHLKNFYYTMEGNPIPEGYVNKIAALFGRVDTPTALGELRTVSFDYLDAITESFAEGLWRLESFSVNVSEVSEVQQKAFLDCKSLKSFSLSVPLTFVNSYAFKNTALTEIDLSHVSYIGGEAFMGCTALEKATVREDSPLEGIGYGAFDGCTSLRSFVMPEKLQRLSNNYLFRGCTSLTDIIFAENSKIRSLPTGIFYGCESLVYINLPDTIRTIGEQAFFGCLSIERFVYPASLREIGDEAFGATGLRSFTLPDESVSIGRALLVYCTSLEYLELPYIPYGESASALFGVRTFDTPEQAMARVSPVLSTVAWSNTSSVLPEYMFYGFTGLRELRLAKQITEVGQYALAGCTALAEFNFAPLTAIGNHAFWGTGLVEVTLPTAITALDTAVFENCRALTAVTLPNTLTVLGDSIFAGCTSLQGIALPNALSALSARAFLGCTSLLEISLPSRITLLGESTFDGCTALRAISLPAGLLKIEPHALRGTALVSLEIPASVTSVGEGVVAGCEKLTQITLPFTGDGRGDFTHLGYIFGVENSELQGIVSVTVSGSVGIIEEAFADCKTLEEVRLLRATSIGKNVFRGSDRLFYLHIPATMTRIDSTAFEGCYRLFEICNKSSLSVPCEYTLSFIANESNRAEERIVGDYRFARYNGEFTLIDYPADGTALSLPADTGFAYGIPHYLFYKNAALTAISLPAAVTAIGEYAFAECPLLTTVRVAENNTLLSRVDPYAFYRCTALERVTLSKRIQSIGAHAFEYCAALCVLTLPSYLVEIGEDAFYNCTSLYDVYYSPASGALPITLGGKDNGYVARYAVTLHASASEGLSEIVNVGDMTFRRYGGDWLLIDYIGTAKTFTLDAFTHDGVRATNIRIAPYALEDALMETLVLGDAVTQIQEGAFAGCPNLRFVTVKSERMTAIEAAAFANCAVLRRVTLPDGITVIEGEAFRNCTLLESINLPRALTTIGDYAFEYCRKLLSVTLPSGLKSIGSYAFRGCDQLYEVYDLTSYITVSRGSNGNGYVGKNAAVVLTSAGSAGLLRYVKDGITFVKINGTYYIYTCEYGVDGTELTIPAYGSDVHMLPRAFAGIAISTLVLPTSVTELPSNAFTASYIYTIYYGGTAAQWAGVTSSQRYGNVLYYAECVHEYGVWTYTANGKITTEFCALSSGRVHTPAECESEGELRYECLCGCGYYESAVLSAPGHKFDADGNCTACDARVEAVTKENLEDYLLVGWINTAYEYTFLADESGALVSEIAGMDGTAAVMSFCATQEMVVTFTVTVSSENDDKLTVVKGGGTLATLSGERQRTMSVRLAAGDVLELYYTKDATMHGGSDTATVSGISFLLYH